MALTPPARSSLEHQAPHATRHVDGPIRVRATRRGFYGHSLREPGAEFGLHSEQEFTAEWMERVETDAAPPDSAAPAPTAAASGSSSGKTKTARPKAEDDVL